MAYQSLYRRYRPQRFSEVKGQDHITRTLRNAVREGRVSHAYLFSGPRGTGKTSTARILAKALNCPNVADGEPCDVCDSCVAITEGRSLDVNEMDAASNRGIDAMRDLIARVSLASPGRWKVYIVDEVHMLTTEAANALLKTLESPPAHVIFVLATTEPQKVLPTVQSRTQPFEFRLLAAQVLADHLRWVAGDAGLDVAPEAIDLVARRGSGSARDALSALDQVAAAGGIEHEGPGADDLVEALCERDVSAALVAVAERLASGHDPRQLTREVLEQLRQAFLATIDRNLVGLPDEDLERVEGQGRRLGRPAAVRAMETLGQSLVDMREAPDPRVLLEVALVRLCRPELDTSPEALLERIDRLERAMSGTHRPGSLHPPPAGADAGGQGPPGPAGGPGPGPDRAGGAGDGPLAGTGSAQAVKPSGPAEARAAARRAVEAPSVHEVTARPPRPAAGAATQAAPAPGGPPAGPDPSPPNPESPASSADSDEHQVSPGPAGGPLAPAAPGSPGPTGPGTAGPPAGPPGPGTAGPPGPGAGAGAAGGRKALGGVRGRAQSPRQTGSAAGPGSGGEDPAGGGASTAGPAGGGASTAGPAAAGFPNRDDLTLAWGDQVLGGLNQRARARFRAGRFTGVEGEVAVFALPDPFHLDRCRECQAEVEEALSAHFGRRVRLRLVVDGEARPAPPASPGEPLVEPSGPEPEEEVPVAWEDLTDAPPGAVPSPLEHILNVFEGAEVVEEER